MKVIRTLLAVLLCAPALGCASASHPDPTPADGYAPELRTGAELLFADATDTLPEADRVEIFQALGFQLAPGGQTLLEGLCGLAANQRVRFEDLNGDGDGEVIVDHGNACTSGGAGSSVTVFIRDGSGRFRPNLGVPGLVAGVLPTSYLGYADLLIGGPGFCFPVWRWDGEAYAYLRNEPQAPGGCGVTRK